MELEGMIRADLYGAIQAHYERKDYTEAVRDTIFFLCEVIREKSGLIDLDGSKLVSDALMGKTPLILVNKNETSTEKDVQQGVGFALKGIMQAVRNPISHEKTILSESDAYAIILYSNYILNKIDKSKSISRLGDITELIYDEDFTNTEEYAKCLIKEVPSKKRYDLLIRIYNDRENLPQNTLGFFINELINTLSKNACDDFIGIVSSSLIKCKDDNALRMYFHYFMIPTYSKIEKLAQLRIEDLVQKSINEGRLEDSRRAGDGNTSRRSNIVGRLATWVNGKIKMFCSYERLIATLYSKLERSEDESEYVFLYFLQDLVREDYAYKPNEIKTIKNMLLKGNFNIYYLLTSDPLFSYEKDNPITDIFGNEIRKCKEILDASDDIPF